jgi:hypothetical protein
MQLHGYVLPERLLRLPRWLGRGLLREGLTTTSGEHTPAAN